MKLLDLISIRNCGDTCQNCVHFQNTPSKIENLYPGLTAMSSGYASVRDKDGLCNLNDIYLSAGDRCSHFNARNNI